MQLVDMYEVTGQQSTLRLQQAPWYINVLAG